MVFRCRQHSFNVERRHRRRRTEWLEKRVVRVMKERKEVTWTGKGVRVQDTSKFVC